MWILQPRQILWLVIIAVAIVQGPQVGVLAQETSPEAPPGPAGCPVEPLPTTFIVDLLALETPDPAPTAIAEIPRGQPADEQTTADVTQVIAQLTACTNAGDYLRAFALFDGAYLRRVIDPDGLMTDEVALELGKTFTGASPVAPDEAVAILSIDAVDILPDSSVVVIFQSRVGPNESSDQTDMFLLRKVDERWLIIDGQSDITT